ncbi:hypothetical protein I6Y99_004998 [Vibrio parahaemolyticus]|uniref:hypothetical protein n=1 Tax=Vibrio parahaemolyticus TaxID=670 RepID=UPI000A4EC8A5|nr:hypothetical protein [Vibrio parahaemolyticus]HDV5446297.1 hypothetical protein [Vibrio cholerae]EGQ7810929.1 hypothetical protein [Vibrio parahaemolyticus]EGQ8536381.1 hypothetical protein [Vibrio parahaemolyticus]EHD0108209.1 hypothetical protein [Vibrio parahaemolyticus]EIV8651584.1 hypothetical protein [Vibrio parahaemolyticus]
MLDITLTSVKVKVKVEPRKHQSSYDRLRNLQKKESHLKALYAEKGLEKPEIMA